MFEERATALYLPPGVEVTITADDAARGDPHRDARGGIGPGQRRGPVLRLPSEVEVLARGRGHYGRDVHNLFVTDPHARRLMVGETFNPPGNWSSFPPHKHDGRNGEPELEEVYHFRVNPPQGFGQQILYTNDGEEVTHVVRDGDVVVLPYGYHPVAAAPGYALYYLWAMVGAERQAGALRRSGASLDSRHPERLNERSCRRPTGEDRSTRTPTHGHGTDSDHRH